MDTTRQSVAASGNHQEVYADEDCQLEPAQLIEGDTNGEQHEDREDEQLMPSGKAIKNLRLLAALAQSIRSLRQARCITQDELAHATGLDRSYIVSIEQGKRNISISKLVQIAAELGLSASQLLRLVEEQLEE